MSCFVTRPPRPVPPTSAGSTPCSAAIRATTGETNFPFPDGSATGAGVGAGGSGTAAAGSGSAATGAGASGAGPGAAAAAPPMRASGVPTS
ncbi:MAG TPA: hypothetical protein VMT74_00925, partial [Gaiellaceae bacterium]|nr:hypothetical protein [Gaiellaceae bacterium]